MCEVLCVSFKSEVPISPSPVRFLQLSPVGLQSQMFWGLFLMQEPHAGEPDMGLRTLTPVGEPLQYNYSPIRGLPTWGVWDLIILRVRPSYPPHYGSIFMSSVVQDLFW